MAKRKKKIYYAVIDTNVVVSSQLKHDSIPGWIIDQVFNGTIIPVFSQEILKEYYSVLTRNKFGFDENVVEGLIGKMLSNGIFFDRTPTNEIFVDKKDVVFYEIVMTGRKEYDSYLVTGNKKHFPKETFVVTPAEMKNIISNG